MKKFSITALAKIIGAHIKQDSSHESRATSHDFFTGVSTDSRTAKPDDCFFAIRGENFDGHNYVVDAFAKGAVCAVVSKNRVTGPVPRGTVLKVNDTVKALGDFARNYRQQAGYKVVAITGSVGKTTTKQIIYHVLSHHYRVHQAPKSFNNNIGVPLTLLDAEPDVQIIIAELGSNHPGEIANLTRIVQPDIAVIANVYPAHLEGFGNIQAIIKEKLSITDGLARNGVLIVNADVVKWCKNFKSPITDHQLPISNRRFITFGRSKGSDYHAEKITHDGFSSTFTIAGTQIHLPIPGLGNIENAVAAWAVCSQFGLSIDGFAEALKTLPSIPMRVETLNIGTITILNDCYNANPASMKNALDILANLNPAGKSRRVFICGDMAELGQQTYILHKELAGHIVKAGVQLLLAIGKSAKITAEVAMGTPLQRLESNQTQPIKTVCFDNTIEACNMLHKFIKDYDIILVKGSRIAKLELVVDKLKELYSPEIRYAIKELPTPRHKWVAKTAQGGPSIEGQKKK